VIPIFFMLLIGIYWFGRAFNTYATINHAAREGARVAVAQTCATCGSPNTHLTADQVADQVKQALQASSLDPAQVSNLGGLRTACGGLVTVPCSTVIASEPQVCVRFNVQLPNTLPNASGPPACGVSIEFQYPYQFALPFTSLDSQRIMLNAGVQMAGEY
jgi:Flp pilus assembly protein TadG